MTQHNVMGTQIAPNSIALGTYSFRFSCCQSFIDNEDQVWIDGQLSSNQTEVYILLAINQLFLKKEMFQSLSTCLFILSSAAYGSIRRIGTCLYGNGPISSYCGFIVH